MKAQGNGHWGAAANILTGIITHIPCCGPQVVMGVWGLKLLGTYSVTVLYQWQFIIPLFISLLTTAWFVYLALRHKNHLRAAAIAKFFAVDLAIGYAIVFALFLCIPPHDHRMIGGSGAGYVTVADHVMTLSFHDTGHLWPWSQRYFIARTDVPLDVSDGEKTFTAKELSWWRALWGRNAPYFIAHDETRPAVARLYSRLNPQALLAGFSNQSVSAAANPIKFYLVVPEQDVP